MKHLIGRKCQDMSKISPLHIVVQYLGRNYLDEREWSAIAQQSVRRLEQLGFKVTLKTAGEAA
jgi:hypothetical protein